MLTSPPSLPLVAVVNHRWSSYGRPIGLLGCGGHDRAWAFASAHPAGATGRLIDCFGLDRRRPGADRKAVVTGKRSGGQVLGKKRSFLIQDEPSEASVADPFLGKEEVSGSNPDVGSSVMSQDIPDCCFKT